MRSERPLFLLGLALAAGALVGATASPAALRGAAALAVAAAVGIAAARRGGDRGVFVQRGAWLVGVALLSAAAAARERAGERLPPTDGAERAGVWSAGGNGERGRLAGCPGGPWIRVRDGAPLDGERVRLAETTELRPWVAGPAREGGLTPTLRERFPSEARPRPDEVVRTERAPPALVPRSVAPLVERARRACAARIGRGLGRESAALARAIVLGDRDALSPELVDLFTRTGTRHLLAVSGLHVALFAALFAVPASRLLASLVSRGAEPRRRRVAALLTAAGVALYAPLAGASAPATRAAIALALACLAPAVDPTGLRRSDTLSLWGLALSVELLAAPLAVLELGVQLSYAATLALLVATRPLARAIERRLGASASTRGPALSPHGSGWRRALLARARRACATALAASIAAGLATLPIAWSCFGELAPIGVVVTPLLVPLLAALLAATWGAIVLGPSFPPAAFDLPREGVVTLLELADATPATPLLLPERPGWWIACASALVLAGLAGRAPALARRVGVAALGVALLPWEGSAATLDVVVLDVGHGTAVALRDPALGTWLFDAGSIDRGGVARRAVLPLLRAWDPDRVSVVASHAHHDHTGALPFVVERVPVARWIGVDPAEVGARVDADTARVEPRAGRAVLARAADRAIEVARGLDREGNEGALSLAVRSRGGDIVLSGDAEGDGLRALLGTGFLDGPVRALLLPHHGSETPQLGPLLARSRPELVWISSSRAPPVGEELARRGIPWRTTRTHGFLRATRSADAGWALSHGRSEPHDERLLETAVEDTRGARRGPYEIDAGVPHPESRGRGYRWGPRHRPPSLDTPSFDGSRLRDPMARLASAPRFALACILAGVAAPTIAAQEAPRQEDASESTIDDDRESDRKRILHLTDGQVLRDRTRWVEGHWEYRRGRQWVALPAGIVERFADEREVLATMRGLERELGSDADPVRRVAFAQWCLGSGLQAEAVAQLDRVLREEPDLPAAIDLLVDSDIPVGGLPRLDATGDELAEQVTELLRSAANSGPSVREIAIARLAALGEDYPLRAELAAALTGGPVRQRSFAAHALRRLHPGTEVQPLLVHAVLDASDEVRVQAALALKAVEDEAVTLPVVRALDSQHPIVRTQAAEALGVMGYPAGVAPLMASLNATAAAQGAPSSASPRSHIFVGKQFAFIQDFDVEVAQFQAVADPQVNVLVTGTVLDTRVLSVRAEHVVMQRSAIKRSLRNLAGVDPGDSIREWNQWWAENQADFLGESAE